MIKLSPTSTTYAADISVNNDKLEEQTAVAEIGTTSTQLTSTLNSVLSRGNLNPNLNLNHIVLKSKNVIEMATGNKELPDDRLESNVNDKSSSPKEKSWNGGHCCPHYCHDKSLQIFTKYKSCDKKMPEKEMIGEYKLLESVAEMVQKYEERSRLESEQDVHTF
ncbi:hypothetical protein LOAG_10249 [Loa loa]|uniref:Uncharacterized protein n=1 Tax=Loa loa TaxID=7209 RepID=A0A1I7VM67_LOALO|nr:hypothetical protein LOAG_10249 [Loa loa]EFO18245.1 hypothetical protein LOAG_10249 [Loa loa]